MPNSSNIFLKVDWRLIGPDSKNSIPKNLLLAYTDYSKKSRRDEMIIEIK